MAITVNSEDISNASCCDQSAQFILLGAIPGNIPNDPVFTLTFQPGADLDKIKNTFVYLQPASKKDMECIAVIDRLANRFKGFPAIAGIEAVHWPESLPSDQLELAPDVFRDAKYPRSPPGKQTAVEKIKQSLPGTHRAEFGPEGTVNGGNDSQISGTAPVKGKKMARALGGDKDVCLLLFRGLDQSFRVGKLLKVVLDASGLLRLSFP
jgi:hypothetical protein